MKIERLLLKAFGPFTELEFDLAGPTGCVNFLFGENEAGKSSSLRALEGLCFGIEAKSQDNHVHSYDQMRVGATLRLADGTAGTFIRRKGVKNTLLDEKGGVLLDAEFEKFLCGVGRSGFEALFCLSYQRLSEGSKTILEENGELGKLLFEARSDLNLRTVLSKLKERSEDLFKGTARSSATIDRALAEYAENRKILKRGDLAEYKSVEKRLSDLNASKRTLEGQRAELRLLESKLRRQLSAIPLVRSILRARAELATLGDVPSLPGSFEQDVRKALHERLTAQFTLDDAIGQSQNLENRIAEIQIDETLLRWRDDITQLNLQVKQIGSVLTDQPVEAKKAIDALADAKNWLTRVRPGEEPDEANLGIDFATNRISALGREKSGLEQSLSSAKLEVQNITSRLSAADSSLNEISLIQVPESLQASVKVAQGLEAEETKLGDRERESKRQRQACLVAASHLGAGDSRLSDFIRISIPTRSVVQGFVEEFLRLDSQIKTLEQDLKLANANRQAAEAERNALLQVGDVPTEAQLLDKRELRNVSWQNLRKQLSPDRSAPIPTEDLSQFEVHVQDSDNIADRLRREADKAARLAAISTRIEVTNHQIQDLTNDLESTRATRAQVQIDWQARWQGSGIEPDSPRQMFEWIDQFRKLCDEIIKLDSLDQDLEALGQEINTARSSLLTALGRDHDLSSLSDLTKQANQLLSQSQQSAGSLRTLERQIKEDRGHLSLAKERLREIEGEISTWQEIWETETACLRLTRTPTPEEADSALKALKEAAESLSRARMAEKRSLGMLAILNRFNGEAQKVINAASPDLADMSPLAAIQTLARQLEVAIAKDGTRRTLVEHLAGQQLRLNAATKAIESQDNLLSILCARAKCHSAEELEVVIHKSGSAIRLQKEIDSASNGLFDLGTSMSVDEFAEEIEPLDDLTLRNQIDDIKVEVEAIDAELNDVNQAIGVERRNLDALDSGNTQVESQRLAEAALAKVRSSVRPYLIYTAAETLLRAQIEEYRRANQGPILKKASEIFSVLTDGSFTELTGDVDDKDERVLIAVRNPSKTGHEERLKVEALSSATRIGLYLALRLACVYHHVEQREGLPFVADDILLDFDDARARRVMEELGRLAEQTQVILFTHHKHLVEIGREVLGDRCLVQNLSKSA
jgi:uncharacterized protein YhaN